MAPCARMLPPKPGLYHGTHLQEGSSAGERCTGALGHVARRTHPVFRGRFPSYGWPGTPKWGGLRHEGAALQVLRSTRMLHTPCALPARFPAKPAGSGVAITARITPRRDRAGVLRTWRRTRGASTSSTAEGAPSSSEPMDAMSMTSTLVLLLRKGGQAAWRLATQPLCSARQLTR